MEKRKTFYIKIHILLQLFHIHRSHIRRLMKVFETYKYIHSLVTARSLYEGICNIYIQSGISSFWQKMQET